MNSAVRYSLIFGAVLLIIGLCVRKGFESTQMTVEATPVVTDGPPGPPSSKLYVSQRKDREHSQRRSNRNWVTRRNDWGSETRRGNPRVGAHSYRPRNPYSN